MFLGDILPPGSDIDVSCLHSQMLGARRTDGRRLICQPTTTSPAVDGNWSAWTNSTPCTVRDDDGNGHDYKGAPCGRGTLIQTRRCNNPAPQKGGNICKGPFRRAVACNVPCLPCTLSAFNASLVAGNCLQQRGSLANGASCNIACV